MTDTTQAALIGAGAVCGALLAMIGFAGAVWRFALPWLREQIVKPVQQTREHVANSHTSNLREDIDAIAAELGALRLEVGAARAEVGAARGEIANVRDQVGDVKAKGEHTDEKVSRIGGQLDAHLTSAAATDAGTHARLTALESRQEHP